MTANLPQQTAHDELTNIVAGLYYDQYAISKIVAYIERRERELAGLRAKVEAETIERCAKICNDAARDWLDGCAEGSEVQNYEDTVLRNAATAIRTLLPAPTKG